MPAYLGCQPKADKSVFWPLLPGTRWYTSNSFFIMKFMAIDIQDQKIRLRFAEIEGHSPTQISSIDSYQNARVECVGGKFRFANRIQR